MRVLVSVCLLACSLCGQAGKLARPSMGFVFDQSTRTLRRIEGIPGAALVGSAVDFGFALSSAYVAPHLDSVFVMADGNCRAHLFRLTADAPRELTVDSMSGCFQAIYSPSGTAAALLSSGSVLVIKGLPDAPVVAATVSLRPNPRPQRPLPHALAISDDGAYLLYGAGGLIELFGVAGDRRQIANGAREVAAAFAPGGHDAAVIQRDKVTLFQDIAGAATERTFPGIEMPSGVAFSPDGQKLYVASMGLQSVTTIQVATGDRTALPCDCTATTLMPMGSLFRLNELGTEPLWLFDTASDRALVFVPAPVGN
jgi:DNA-binding beta-propeller fold protein YncE